MRHVASFVVLGLVGLIIPSTLAEDPTATSASPHSIRMWIGPDAGTQMLLAWGTESLAPQMVEYAAGVGLPQRAVAQTAPFPTYDGRDGTCDEATTAVTRCYEHPGVGYVHVAKLSGLAPGTTYTYRVGADSTGWSPPSTFRTAPRAFAGPVTFTAFGDSPPSDPVFRNDEPAFTSLNAKLAADAGAAFHLHLGDINYVDSAFTRHVEWWRRWFDEQQPLMRTAPYMWALGNHDRQAENWEAYLLGVLPQWDEAPFPVWSFRWGDILVVSVWQDMTLGPVQTPAAALDAELSRPEYADAKWKIVTMHAGPYAARWLEADGTREGHGSNCPVRAAYSPVFADHDVDLVLSGHDHHYERSYPVKPENGLVRVPRDPERYPATLGTTYVVAGSGGRLSPEPTQWTGLVAGRACDPDLSFLAQFKAEVAHVSITETTTGLTVRGVRYDGVVLDDFTILG